MTNKTPIDLTIRPTHVSSRHTGALVCTMREHGREELVHYAAAAHRDDVAWAVVKAWLKHPRATEAELKSSALAEVYGWCITADEIRAAVPGGALMLNRSCLLTSPNNKDHTGAIVAITDAQLEALSAAAYHSEIGILRRHHFALVQLLRAVAPDDATLRMLDQRARDNGFVCAGSDEQVDVAPDAG